MDARLQGLSSGAHCLYLILKTYPSSETDGIAWPSQESLAQKMGRSVKSIYLYLRELEGAGILRVCQTGLCTTNVYHFVEEGEEVFEEEMAEVISGPDRKRISGPDRKRISGPIISEDISSTTTELDVVDRSAPIQKSNPEADVEILTAWVSQEVADELAQQQPGLAVAAEKHLKKITAGRGIKNPGGMVVRFFERPERFGFSLDQEGWALESERERRRDSEARSSKSAQFLEDAKKQEKRVEEEMREWEKKFQALDALDPEERQKIETLAVEKFPLFARGDRNGFSFRSACIRIMEGRP